MKGRRVFYLLAAVAALAAALLVPGTAGATTASNLICGASLDHSIVMNGDLDCSGYTSGPAVTITKSGVTLDLGGHTLTGASSGSYDVVVADDTCTDTTNSNCDNVTVTNGKISGGYDQIDFWGNSDTATNLTLDSARDEGVYLDYAYGSNISNNTISNAADTGIYGYYSAGVYIGSNVLKDNNYENVDIYYNLGDSVEGNVSSENLGNPALNGSTENYYEEYSSQDLYYGNTATGGTYGFDLEPYGVGTVTVSGNGARSASDEGFYTYEAYNWTSEYGSGPVSLISGNIATANAVGFEDDSESYDSVWQNNLANNNTSDGFEFYYTAGGTVTGNTAQYNGGDGFYLYDLYADEYPLNSLANNKAWYNQDFGFESNDPIAGSGNTGKSSGGAQTNNEGDCYYVSGCS